MNVVARTVLVGVCSVGLTATSPFAYAGTAKPYSTIGPGEGGYTWSDCLYASPAPADSYAIAAYSISSGPASGTYVLDCGGVRHINAGHAFNSDTEGCIYDILRGATYKETSRSNSANDQISRAWASSPYYFSGYVITAKTGNHRIVTAYTDTNISTISYGAAWSSCEQYLG